MRQRRSSHPSFRVLFSRFAAFISLTVASLFSCPSLVTAQELTVTPGLTLASPNAGKSGEIRLALELGESGIPDISNIELPPGTPAMLSSFSLSELDLTLRLTPTAGTVNVTFDTILITYRDGTRENVFIGPTEVNWLDQPVWGKLANLQVLATPSEQVPFSILLHNQGSEPLILNGFHYAPQTSSSGRILYGRSGDNLGAIHYPVLRAHDEQVPRYPVLPPLSFTERLNWPLRTAKFTPPATVQWLNLEQESLSIAPDEKVALLLAAESFTIDVRDLSVRLQPFYTYVDSEGQEFRQQILMEVVRWVPAAVQRGPKLSDLLGRDPGFSAPLHNPFSTFKMPLPSNPTSSTSLHLQQSYRKPFAGSSSFSLGPTIRVSLHDPARHVGVKLAGLRHHLEVLDEQAQAAGLLLNLHGNGLLLQHFVILSRLINQYLAAVSPAVQSLHALAANHDTGWPTSTRAAMDPALQKAERDWLDKRETAEQLRSAIELVSLTLETETAIPAEQFTQVESRERPTLQIEEGAETFDICLSRSPRFQRQLLYPELDLLEAQEQVLRRKAAVSLDAGANLSIRDLETAPRTDLSWSLSLSVTAPKLAQAGFSVGLDEYGLTQRSSFSWPEQSGYDDRTLLPDDGMGVRRAALHLQELHLRLASTQRSLARLESVAARSMEVLAVHAKPEAVMTEDLPLLSLAVNDILSLLQAELEFDQTLLELAAECQLPVVYEPVEDPLTAFLFSRPGLPAAAGLKSARQ